MADEQKSKGGKAGKAGKAADKTAEKAAPKAKKASAGEAQAPRAASKGSRGARGGEGTGRGAVSAERPRGPVGKPRMAKLYEEQVRPELMQKFGYHNVMQAPRFEKIVVNMGVGDALQDAKLLEAAANVLG